MDIAEYLVSYGKSGDFSRFRPATPAAYRRGDRVVVRTSQGLEIGVIMCAASAGHTQYLSRSGAGELIRPASGEDEHVLEQERGREQRIFEDARRLTAELELPLEILDAELLLDGSQVIIHHLRQIDCDYRPLVSALARRHDVLITMQNMALPAAIVTEEAGGCGQPGCGGGGCGSCGSGGGCSTGSCGTKVPKEEVAAYLSGLRQRMEARSGRMPLL